jgi:diguanylate cyclase (GGDEF)-like protein
MVSERYLFFALLIISSFITAGLTFVAQKRGHNTESKLSSLILLAITFYSFGYAFELISNTLPQMVFWSRLQYLGIVNISPLWLILALHYNGFEKWLTRPVIFIIYIIPVLTLILHHTNLFHLYYLDLRIVDYNYFPIFAPVKGPWYWVQMVYQTIVNVTGLLIFVISGRKTNKLYNHQVIVILIGFLLPWIGNIIYLSGHSPLNLDLASLTLSLTALIICWGLKSFRLFDIVPIARTKVFESIRDGVIVLDNQNRIVDLNNTAKEMLGLSEHCIGLKSNQTLSDFPLLLKQLLSRERQVIISFENNNRINFIESRLSEIWDSFKKIIGYTLILCDQSEQIELLNKLRTLATVDSLTDVYNRRHFFEVCQQKLQRLQQANLPVAFILIDLDYFKEINDTHGHQTGDRVLGQAITNLRKGLTEKNIIGRVGGEEFAILLPECELTKAILIAEQLRALLDCTIQIDDGQIHLTASFGLSFSENSTIKLDLLLSQADIALYRSKADGRNTMTVFSPEMANPKKEISDIVL